MGGFTSLATAVSGLNAAQTGLYVTGHNMANSGTSGYSRQRTVQTDFLYNSIGYTPMGALKMGLGTDVGQIQQIRNKYLDISYRQETSKLGYYTARATAGEQIESIFGELQSQYNAQSVIHDLQNVLNELMAYPQGQETRSAFISRCTVFLDKMNNVYDRLFQYQHNLDDQIRKMTTTINKLVTEIDDLNGKIALAQMSGDQPNDYMDRRNECLDELSLYMNIEYSTGKNGRIDIFTEGKELLVNGFRSYVGLQYISGDYSFVQPILTNAPPDGIVSAGETSTVKLFNYMTSVNSDMNNDKGQLKGLFYARGLYPANYTDLGNVPGYTPSNERVANVQNFFIPNVMAELDLVFNKIVTMINDAMAPNKNGPPYNNYYIAGDPDDEAEGLWENVEIFSRKYSDQYDYWTDSEKPSDYYSLYTIGNIVINPALSEDGGYNRIALSLSGDIDDPNLVLGLIDDWKDKSKGVAIGGSEKLAINSAYERLVVRIGTRTDEALGYVEEQTGLVNQLDNKRQSIMGVSLDEEMKNMMVYQHAYNASARVINVIDSMIDKIVNGTGRVGR